MTNVLFDGFSPALFAYLTDLAKHNNRTWFQSNKSRYQEVVVDPMGQFIEAMAPRLTAISEHFVADPRPNGGSMFRIYRDTRFSKDKRPYKDNVGCHFRHSQGRDAHAPGFYVHLAPGQILFGGGIWKPDSSSLAKIRMAIVDNPSAWQAATHDKAFLDYFTEVRGERLKRPPRGYSPANPMLADLKLKSFFVMREADVALACSRDFTSAVEKAFVMASPMMSFLAFALELPYNRPRVLGEIHDITVS